MKVGGGELLILVLYEPDMKSDVYRRIDYDVYTWPPR